MDRACGHMQSFGRQIEGKRSRGSCRYGLEDDMKNRC
jgi:hypothetical protein